MWVKCVTKFTGYTNRQISIIPELPVVGKVYWVYRRSKDGNYYLDGFSSMVVYNRRKFRKATIKDITPDTLENRKCF